MGFTESRRGNVDFLTGLPYWGIIVIVVINAIIVARMDIQVDETDPPPQ
ncbi:MAG: hypothetical protein O3A63_15225 [Proteobacteria bacterium]|nr:hypothetical protein [Pseudomonadota bacterium]